MDANLRQHQARHCHRSGVTFGRTYLGEALNDEWRPRPDHEKPGQSFRSGERRIALTHVGNRHPPAPGKRRTARKDSCCIELFNKHSRTENSPAAGFGWRERPGALCVARRSRAGCLTPGTCRRVTYSATGEWFMRQSADGRTLQIAEGNRLCAVHLRDSHINQRQGEPFLPEAACSRR
jgi:hypothetical protein